VHPQKECSELDSSHSFHTNNNSCDDRNNDDINNKSNACESLNESLNRSSPATLENEERLTTTTTKTNGLKLYNDGKAKHNKTLNYVVPSIYQDRSFQEGLSQALEICLRVDGGEMHVLSCSGVRWEMVTDCCFDKTGEFCLVIY